MQKGKRVPSRGGSLGRKSGEIATREAVGWGGGKKVNGEEIWSKSAVQTFLLVYDELTMPKQDQKI